MQISYVTPNARLRGCDNLSTRSHSLLQGLQGRQAMPGLHDLPNQLLDRRRAALQRLSMQLPLTLSHLFVDVRTVSVELLQMRNRCLQLGRRAGRMPAQTILRRLEPRAHRLERLCAPPRPRPAAP